MIEASRQANKHREKQNILEKPCVCVCVCVCREGERETKRQRKKERERDSVPEELRLEKLIVITSVPEVGGKRISAGPPPRSYRNPMQESGRGSRLPDQGKRYRGRVLCEFQCLVSRAAAPLPLGKFTTPFKLRVSSHARTLWTGP